MFGRIRKELQCFKGYGYNSNIWKDKVRIPVFGRIGPDFQCLEKYVQIPVFGRTGQEFQYFVFIRLELKCLDR